MEEAIYIIKRLIDAMKNSEEFSGEEHVIQKAQQFIKDNS